MNQKEWKNNLISTLKKISIDNFKSIAIYQEAFCHKSYANEKRLSYNQQRLEFLGDAAIGWIITNYLYGIKPKISEGEMTIIKSQLVNKRTLAKAAKELNLDKLLYLGKGASNSEITDKILEDTFEAFVGAIAQDQGIKKVIKLLDLTLVKYHQENLVKFTKDYKTQFQELVQSISSQKDHKIEYKHEIDGDVKICKLYYMDNLYGIGKAKNYREAEQLAAQEALSKCQILSKGD